MRLVAVLSALLALAGCDKYRATSIADQGAVYLTNADLTAIQPDDLPDDWLERLRTTPLPSEVAVNNEYQIMATFRRGDPVCVADSGGHIHGFYQTREGLCGSHRDGRVRFIGVWADYNAADYTEEQAISLNCEAGTEPFDLGMEPAGAGRLAACRNELAGVGYEATVVYLPRHGGAPASEPPSVIYRVSIGIGPRTEAADMAEAKAFLSRLRLGGVGFRPTAS